VENLSTNIFTLAVVLFSLCPQYIFPFCTRHSPMGKYLDAHIHISESSTLISKSRTDTSYPSTRFRELVSHKAIEIHYVPRGFTHKGMVKAHRDIGASETRRGQDKGHTSQRRDLPLRALSTAIRKVHKAGITVTALEQATRAAVPLAIPLITVPAVLANTYGGRRMGIDWHTERIDANYANGHTRDLYNGLTDVAQHLAPRFYHFLSLQLVV